MMRILTAVGCVAAIAMIAASATMNYLFMHSLGRSEIEGHVLGVVSVAVDVLKALLAVFVAVAARRHARTYVMIGSVAFIVFSIASFLSAIGFSAQNRAGVAEAVAAKTNNLSDADIELKRLLAKLLALPAARPVNVIEVEIRGAQFNARWTTSRQCSSVSSSEQRSYCQSVARLDAELATAREAEKLEVQASELRVRLTALRGRVQEVQKDSQTGMLARVFGLDANVLRLVLAAFVALVVEIASGLGLYLATGHMAPQPEKGEAPSVIVEGEMTNAASTQQLDTPPMVRLSDPAIEVGVRAPAHSNLRRAIRTAENPSHKIEPVPKA